MRKTVMLIICTVMMISLLGVFSIKTIVGDPISSPTLSNPYPNNRNATYNPKLSITVNDNDNDDLTVIFKTNASGPWVVLGTYHGGNKKYTQNTTDMMIKNNTYFWSINVTDGTTWVNNTYSFVAKPFVFKWSHDTNAITSIGPLAVDVNNDSIYEVFSTGYHKVTCLNGNTGTLIWNYTNPAIINHSAFEIADLNKDGIPEIVISGDITFDGKGKTIALHANNGTVYWIAEAESAQKYLCIADIDGNGYPYVYVTSGNPYEGTNGSGRLRKLRGTDGVTLKDVFVWRPCWGGPSIADADNDGKFELYLCDRRANYSSHDGPKGQLALGMQCYDAETLDLLWYQDTVTCSSHMLMLADVNNDGVLDAVACNQATHSGIYTVDGVTWDKMPGQWANSIDDLFGAHTQPTLGDCDGDGRLELIVSKYGPTVVWDMGLWAVDFILPDTADPPCIADVYGDSRPEIIAGSYNGSSIRVYDGSSGALLENVTPGGIAHMCVQDIDNDGQNELITISGTGNIRTYDTSAYTPTPRVRTNNQYYSERRTATGIYTPTPGAPQPIIKTISPLDNAQDVSLNPTLRAQVIDYHHDLMNITIDQYSNGSWNTLASYHDVGNGWHNITTSTMNQKNTTYIWRVTAFDAYADRLWTNKTYRFTTLASPIISDIVTTPSDILPGGFVNISCNIIDGTIVQVVKVNITAPNGKKTNTTASGGNPGWSVLTYDDFESGIGNYTDGGTSCSLNTNPTYAHQGTRAVKIQDYQGLASSFYLTDSIDVDTPRYTSIKVDFWFKTESMSNLTNFWVKYYDGQHWRIIDNYIKPGPVGIRPADKPFTNDNFIHGITWINETKYNFSTNMKIRFECDALSSINTVYIDQIYVNATTTQGPDYYLNYTNTRLGTYQYFIWARDIVGNSYRSTSKSFKISNNPQPYPPDDPNPSNDSTSMPITVDLSWTGGDPDPTDNVTYDVYFGTSTAPPIVVYNQADLSYNPGTLEYNKLYYWRIIAKDSQNLSAEGPLWHFTTASQQGGGSSYPSEPENEKPIANITIDEPFTGYSNALITFNASRSSDFDGEILQWLWVFDDGTNGTGKILQHSYQKPGEYTVTLTVIDDSDEEDKDTKILFIVQQNRAPSQPVIEGPTNGNKNITCVFTIFSTDLDNDSIQYIVDWGDTSFIMSEYLPNGTNYYINHTWKNAGIYYLHVRVSDNQIESNDTRFTILIDTYYVSDFGYLINKDTDTIYETFYNNQTGNESRVEFIDESYRIDINGDGNWDYLYSEKNGISEYVHDTPGFETLLMVCAITLVFLWKRKKR